MYCGSVRSRRGAWRTAIPPSSPTLDGRPMRRKHEWILRALIESVLIVASIVLALAVDEWRENRQNQELADQSLTVFEREIRQNLRRLEDVVPYHAGLHAVVQRMDPREVTGADLRSVLEGLEPTVLLSTAWETALATGALTHIDFQTVSALSLTYSLQSRFVEESRSQAGRLLEPRTISTRSMAEQIDRARGRLASLTQREQELLGVYRQVLEVIDARRAAEDPETEPDTFVDTLPIPHP